MIGTIRKDACAGIVEMLPDLQDKRHLMHIEENACPFVQKLFLLRRIAENAHRLPHLYKYPTQELNRT